MINTNSGAYPLQQLPIAPHHLQQGPRCMGVPFFAQEEEKQEEVRSEMTSHNRTDSLDSNDTMADETSGYDDTASHKDLTNPNRNLHKPIELNENIKTSSPDPNLNITSRLETGLNLKVKRLKT